ncbi:ABC transporter permease [Mycobacteroides abscessus]|uniref:ABC transporter permease n=1 Tax=Mycobacteroides abscessus TaxID=36809 RepID=UPI001896804A
MSAHDSASTAPGRAYRWWGVGAITCLVLAVTGLLGAIASAFSSSPEQLWVAIAVAVFVLIPAGILGGLYCGHRRYRARFTNAHVSEAPIEEVTEVRRTNDDGSVSRYFMLTVSVAVEGGPAIRRHCTVGGDHPRPRIGQTLRFRHTTLDPDDLEDALFDSIREHQRGTG